MRTTPISGMLRHLFTGEYLRTGQTRLLATPDSSTATSPTQPARSSPKQLNERFTLVDVRSLRARTLLLATQPPQLRRTKWHLGQRHTDRILSLPRLLFVGCFFRGVFEELYLFFLRRPYRGGATPLYHSILPNSTETGWVCLGTTATKAELMARTRERQSNSEKIDAVIEEYWDSHFNTDLIDRLRRGQHLHPNLETIARWERASRREPKFISHVPWELVGTINTILSNIAR